MILVVGGTGSLGSRIVHGLRQRGEAVRALVRRTSHSTSLAATGVQILQGDLKEPASLRHACERAEVVISTATMSKRGDDSVENVDLRGNQNLIDAAAHAGVRRFVFVSTIGAAPDSPLPLFRAKGLAEKRLRESGMEFTILEPDAFMDVWFGMLVEQPVLAHRPVTLVGDATRRHAFIAERDVAAFATAAARHPAAKNTTMMLGGPEAITFRDAVRAYETAAGHAIEVRSVPPGAPIPGLPEQVWGIVAALESHDSVVPMEATAKRFGIRLTSVADFARQSRLATALRRPA